MIRSAALLLITPPHGSDPIAVKRLWYLQCFEHWFARTHRGEPLT